MIKAEKLSRAVSLVMTWAKTNAVLRREQEFLESIDWNYQESHETTGEIHALANWNALVERNATTGHYMEVSDVPRKLQKLLEAIGVDVLWEDEWMTCSECGQLVGTNPQSAWWMPRYTIRNECEVCCLDCIKKDAESYLQEHEGHIPGPMHGINPADHGYVKVMGDQESPFEFREPNFERMMKEYALGGVDRFIVQGTGHGQFQYNWAGFVHKTQIKKFMRRFGRDRRVSG